jgi:para-nitrobenzyl esterase
VICRRIPSWLIAVMVMTLSAIPALATPSPAIKIDTGLLQGRPGQSADLYLGIPYAAPPVGELRWRPPQPAKVWDGVRDAAEYGPSCPQSLDSPMMMVSALSSTSEDCLTLNVWKPRDGQGGPHPVMVWIHGGGFFTGAGSEAQFDGEPYARRGVILVTVNYRLGRLGFFAHPALSVEQPDEPHGNYGLMDILAALRWVRANIGAFGGDPGDVTIFGESAGGIAVAALMTSPLAAGLFHKAIVESGAFPRPMRDMRKDRPDGPSTETLGRMFAEGRGIFGPDAVAALRALPVDALAPPVLSPTEVAAIQAMAAPMIDGRMFTEDVFTSFARGRVAKLPLLIGGNSLEALVWAFGPNGRMATYPLLRADPAKLSADLAADADRIIEIYRARFGGDRPKAMNAIATDMAVGAGSRFLANSAAAGGAPIWLYRFSAIPTPLRSLTPGAPHGAEVPYVFGTLAKLRNVGGGTTPADEALSRKVIDYWVSFAKNGDPNGPGRPIWPAHTAANGAFLEFTDQGPVAGADVGDAAMDIFERRIAISFAPPSAP